MIPFEPGDIVKARGTTSILAPNRLYLVTSPAGEGWSEVKSIDNHMVIEMPNPFFQLVVKSRVKK
jgi:hypothetical protein